MIFPLKTHNSKLFWTPALAKVPHEFSSVNFLIVFFVARLSVCTLVQLLVHPSDKLTIQGFRNGLSVFTNFCIKLAIIKNIDLWFLKKNLNRWGELKKYSWPKNEIIWFLAKIVSHWIWNANGPPFCSKQISGKKWFKRMSPKHP